MFGTVENSTLLIDETFGASCATYAALSAFGDLDAAIENLCAREGMPSPKGVGFVRYRQWRAKRTSEGSAPTCCPRDHGLGEGRTAMTRLSGRRSPAISMSLQRQAGLFSAEAVIRYLEKLDAPKINAALSYVRKAPLESPVRAAVNKRWPEE